MSKTTKESAAAPPAPVSHLDDKITQLVARTRRTASRFKLPILIAALAGVAVLAAYGMLSWFSQSREEGLSARLFTLTEGPGAKDQNPAVVLGDLRRLVEEARGSEGERYILKAVTQYLLERAFTPKANELDDLPGAAAPPSTASSAAASPDVSLLVKQVEEFSARAVERFPGDADMREWALNLQKKLKSEADFKSKAVSKRTFKPLPPSAPVPPLPAPAPGGASPPSGAPADPGK